MSATASSHAMAWAALGLRPDAPQAEVKSAYRKLLRAYHPDTGSGNRDLLEKVQELYRQVSESWAGRDRTARARSAAADASRCASDDRDGSRRTTPVDAYRVAGRAARPATLDVLA